MTLKATVLSAGLAIVAEASQPGASSPVEAPMRDLQWAGLNFLHTTDTHGWHGGHLQEPQYSADWGDYISFASHLRARADAEGRDLLLVDTGDRVEGNGLYDSSSPQGKYTHDIFHHQPIDLICTGNHELYVSTTADREHAITVPNFPDNYIASNLDYIVPETGEQIPMAQRFKRFTTKNQGIDIVAFGFLFDFTGNANNTVVQPVEETVEEEWFLDAINIRTQPDLFVVIGHVGVRMEEFKIIYRAIRKRNWFAPIAFFGGHHHVRDSATYDSRAFALASGRYFETVGWMSIDGIIPKTVSDTAAVGAAVEGDNEGGDAVPEGPKLEKAMAGVTFNRRYIDNNLFGFQYHAGLNDSTFPTDHGQNISDLISSARESLTLDHRYGCAPKSLWMTRSPLGSEDSIYTWLQEHVLPDKIVNKERKEKPRLAIMNTGAIRFDIFQGAFTTDSTYIVSPFKSGMNYLPDVPYAVASKVAELLNKGSTIFDYEMGAEVEAEGKGKGKGKKLGLGGRFMGIPQQLSHKNDVVYTAAEKAGFRAQRDGQQKPLSDEGDEEDAPVLINGYTTRDDVSTEGDDTVHAPIDFYTVPNVIQAAINIPAKGGAEPETVDLVFMDFIQPWVLLAVRYVGGEFGGGDVERYQEGTFTEMMAEWIRENWNEGDC